MVRKITLLAFLLLALWVPSSSMAWAELSYDTLYMNRGGVSPSELYIVDTSGNATLVGDIKSGTQKPSIRDMAFDGTTLFMITTTELYKINDFTPVNGVIQATSVGTFGGSPPIGGGYNALAADTVNHVLYAANTASPGSFIKIDETTGVGSLIGNFGPKQGGNFISSVGDLAFGPGGVLYASVHWNSHTPDSRLATVNLTNGNITFVDYSKTMGFDVVDGISFRDGILYGVTNDKELITIDTSTGVGTLVQGNIYNAHGLATSPGVPVPPSLVLFGSGMVGLVLMGFRRKNRLS